MAKIPTKQQLINALNAAAQCHHDYERGILGGVRDEHWAGFYAAFTLGQLGSFASASNLTKWLQEVSDTDNWSESAAAYVLAQL